MRGNGTTYNHLWKYALAAVIGALFIGAASFWPSPPHGEAGVTILGVDAIPDASNTASNLGTIDECREVSVGQDFDVDVYIQNTNDLKDWELYFGFDPSVVEVALDGDSNPQVDIGFFQPGLPVLQGYASYYFIGVANLTAGPGSTGQGVLARITLHAKGLGVSNASINVNPAPPHLWNSEGSMTTHTSPILNARIAVGQSCAGSPTLAPTPTPPPTLVPTPSPSPAPTATATPTVTPVPDSIPWGDIDCGNGVTVNDAIYIAMLKAGTDVSPIRSPCPAIGDQLVGAAIAVNWGDFDCSGQFDLGDAIAIMRYLIGLTGGVEGCPHIATNYVQFP